MLRASGRLNANVCRFQAAGTDGTFQHICVHTVLQVALLQQAESLPVFLASCLKKSPSMHS